MHAGVRAIAAALALFFASSGAVAQLVPPSEQPGRERQRFEIPARPLAQPGGPAIALPGIEAPPGAAETTLVIRGIRIIGATVYTAQQFEDLYADLVGETVTLLAVYDVARRITAKYGADGYVLSRAIVPPQRLDPAGADVRIQVVEGYVERVEWPPQLATYVDFFSDYAARITSERPANIRTIERNLLLAGDLPGLKFKNSLKPHPSRVGAAILVVEVTAKPADLFGRVDNRGTKARGPMQFLTTATANNLLRIHEAFSVSYAGAFETKELQYYAASYRQVLNSQGLSAFINASYGYGRPGTVELELLRYRTRSAFLEAGLNFPVVRSRELNINVGGLWFGSDDRGSFFDLPDTPPSTLDKLRGFRLKLEADAADQFGGISQMIYVFSQGIQGLGSTQNGNELASRANGRVDFTKMEIFLSRMQPMSPGFSLLTAVYGQYALTPLLTSELCGYGGRIFGRAFDPSQITADSCLEVLGEVRYDLPAVPPALTQAQLYGFADHGWLHNLAPVAGSVTQVDASSVGAGLRLGWFNALGADVSVAQAVQGPRRDTRLFFVFTGRL
jgi:hemolysin activation/secretion protein